MCFNFLRYIFRNDLVKVWICFINFFYSVIEKRDQVSRIFNTNYYARPLLGVLETIFLRQVLFDLYP